MKWITEDFTKKLTDKIRSFETQTSIEFVPVVSERSSSYLWPRAFMAVANGTFFHFCFSHLYHLSYSWLNMLALLGFCMAFALILWIPAVARFILPGSLFVHEVEKKALECFCLEEIFKTQARTGVLVFVSLFERKVFVLADKGLSAHVPQDFWKKAGLELALDFAAHKPGDRFFEALDKFLKDAAPHYPPTSENPNELSDELRRR